MSDKIKIGDLVEWTEELSKRLSFSPEQVGVVIGVKGGSYYIHWAHRRKPLLIVNKDHVQPVREKK